jgi:DNA uptake protein ComE-like DNA-binding protein
MRSFFYFSRPEREGILVLCTLLLLLLLFPRLYGRFFAPAKPLPWAKLEVDTLPAAATPPRMLSPDTLFVFDPNRVEKEELISLGLAENLAQRLINYRSKGGRFWKSEDLLRIYGMDSLWHKRVADYVKIEVPKTRRASKKTKTRPQRSAYSPTPLDINAADQVALKALPGIGAYRAERITRFRDKLGGFYSLDQVSQTYGLPDSVFQRIRPIPLLYRAGLQQTRR